jgi:hypothetical protein
MHSIYVIIVRSERIYDGQLQANISLPEVPPPGPFRAVRLSASCSGYLNALGRFTLGIQRTNRRSGRVGQ